MKKLKNSSLEEQISARVQLNKDSFVLVPWLDTVFIQIRTYVRAFAEKLLLKRRTASPE